MAGAPGWLSVPVAFSVGNGTFNVSNAVVASFPAWAATGGTKVVAGDFNGDKRDDLAVAGASGWLSVPVAFSVGNGSFNVTNAAVASFPAWAATPGARMVAGDFNADGRDDLALTGGNQWMSLPIASSRGNGTFAVTNQSRPDIATWAQAPVAQTVAGDFDGGGRADLALTGGIGWQSVPVAFAQTNATFFVTNYSIP